DSVCPLQDGDFQFSLDSVKALGALMGVDDALFEQEVRLVEANAAAVCSHPALPEDFKPLCLRRDSGAVLARLALVAVHSDVCDICASAACTGC
ncbi:hypothetical protein L3Q82_015480, partial [Scortum barcoo]